MPIFLEVDTAQQTLSVCLRGRLGFPLWYLWIYLHLLCSLLLMATASFYKWLLATKATSLYMPWNFHASWAVYSQWLTVTWLRKPSPCAFSFDTVRCKLLSRVTHRVSLKSHPSLTSSHFLSFLPNLLSVYLGGTTQKITSKWILISDSASGEPNQRHMVIFFKGQLGQF